MPQAEARVARAEDAAQPQSRERSYERRTVVITGHPGHQARREAMVLPSRGPRIVEIDRRRPARRAQERLGSNPDRIAMWAVMLALFLVLVTALSAHA